MHNHELTTELLSGPVRDGELEAEFPPNYPKDAEYGCATRL
jgi:hypothetical protein